MNLGEGKVLADFIAKFTPNNFIPTPMSDIPELWVLYVDGASNSKGFGFGVVLMTPDETIIEQSYSLGFVATNNEADYKAFIVGMKMAEILGVKHRGTLRFYAGSKSD